MCIFFEVLFLTSFHYFIPYSVPITIRAIYGVWVLEWTFPKYAFYRNEQIPKDISQKQITERTFPKWVNSKHAALVLPWRATELIGIQTVITDEKRELISYEHCIHSAYNENTVPFSSSWLSPERNDCKAL